VEPEYKYNWRDERDKWIYGQPVTDDDWKFDNMVDIYKKLIEQPVTRKSISNIPPENKTPKKKPIIATEKDVGTDVLQRLKDL